MTDLEQAVTNALRSAGLRYGLNWEDLAYAAFRAIDDDGYLVLHKNALVQLEEFARHRRRSGDCADAAADVFLESAAFLRKVACVAREQAPPASGENALAWAQALYDFLLREFAHPDPSCGHVVTADARPHFDALCVFLASNGLAASPA